jgi:hypothetical protein
LLMSSSFSRLWVVLCISCNINDIIRTFYLIAWSCPLPAAFLVRYKLLFSCCFRLMLAAVLSTTVLLQCRASAAVYRMFTLK